MRYLLIVCLSFALLAPLISVADTLDYQRIDSITYSLYATSNWSSLYTFSKDNASNNLGYYFWARAAYSALQMKEYGKARLWAIKANRLNSIELFSSFLLDSSNLALGYYEKIHANGTAALSGLLKNRVLFESGVAMNTRNDAMGNFYYSTVGFRTIVKNRWHIGFNTGTVLQNKYYIGYLNPGASNFEIDTSVNYNSSQYYNRILVGKEISQKLGVYSSFQFINNSIGNLVNNNTQFSIWGTYTGGRFRSEFGFSNMNLNQESQNQIESISSFFVNSNKIRQISLNTVYQIQTNTNNLYIEPSISGKFLKKFNYTTWFSTKSLGYSSNIHGYIIFNRPDIARYRFGGSLSYPFKSKVTASIYYSHENMTQSYQSLPYNLNNLTINISYGF